MPTTRKQKKARKSRRVEMLSDIENLPDNMLGESHFNGPRRDESLDSTSIRRHESVTSNSLENESEGPFPNLRNPNVGADAGYGQNSADMSSQAEINKLSSETNKLSRNRRDDEFGQCTNPKIHK